MIKTNLTVVCDLKFRGESAVLKIKLVETKACNAGDNLLIGCRVMYD